MTKYLDDVANGDVCERMPIRGSSIQAEFHNDAFQGTGCRFFDDQGKLMPKYGAKLTREFYGRELNAQLAREIAARCREDFPA